LLCQQAGHHGVEERHRLVEPLLDRRVAHPGQAEHGCPGGRLAQRQATGAARQRQAQQVGAAGQRALALDGFGLPREPIEIQPRRQPVKQLVELIRRERCCVLHLPQESYRFASRQAVS
jgi:hypothetical protein